MSVAGHVDNTRELARCHLPKCKGEEKVDMRIIAISPNEDLGQKEILLKN